jgi:hypothetical protein
VSAPKCPRAPRLKPRDRDVDNRVMPWLLPVSLAAALVLFGAWVAALLRLDRPGRAAAAALPVVGSTPQPAPEPAHAVVLFPSCSGVGGDGWLLMGAGQDAA